MNYRSIIYIVLIIPLFVFPNISSNHGIEGAINTPSAYINDEGELKLSLYRGIPDRKIIVTANPFNWMQASLFYVDVTNRIYPGDFKQSYKDKGFNLKINLLKEGNFPALSVGFNDFAGTGLYNSEYIVLSRTSENISYSLGIGWGDFSSGIKIKNPLISISDSFQERDKLLSDLGGTINSKTYFRGKDASLFGSFIYRVNSKLSYLLELDPTVTNKYDIIPYTRSKSKFSIGSYYKLNKNVHFKAAIERGSEATFSIIFNESFKDFKSDPSYRTYDEDVLSSNRYQNLQKILELNAVGLNSVSEDSETIRLNVKQNRYNNTTTSNRHIYQSLKDSGIISEGKDIEIIHTFLGMEVKDVVIEGSTSPFFNGKEKRNKDDLERKYIVLEKFPIIHNSINIDPRLFIASREGFLHGGILLNNDTEILLKENLIISSNLRYSLYDNFDELYIPSVDSYPAVVRSDVKKYLNNLDNGVTIGRLQLDYFLGNNKNFFQFSIGILEDMFAGMILDYLYFPQNSMLGLGVEQSFAKKRNYDGRLSLLDYQNHYTRIKAVLREPKNNIITTLSYGEYLAGDKGYTLEIDKRFKNGVKFGVFFSRTDVPTYLYGEGSFDKGIKLSIPFGFRGKTITNFKWRPLTKDPAALLVRKNNLIDLIERYRN